MTDFLAHSAPGGNGLTALFCILLLLTNFIVWWLNENSWPAQFVALPRLLCISNRQVRCIAWTSSAHPTCSLPMRDNLLNL